MKIAVVTGASGGIGKIIALSLANSGIHTVFVGRNEKELIKCVSGVESSEYVIADMTDAAEASRVIHSVIDKHGKIDILVNNLGQNKIFGNIWETEVEDWVYEFSTNLYSAVYSTITVLKHMVSRNSGYVINMAGGGVEDAFKFASSYAASKTAITRFTETVGEELAAINSKVKVFALNPGLVDTPHTRSLAVSEKGKKFFPGLEDLLNNKTSLTSEAQIGEIVKLMISGKIDNLSGHYIVGNNPIDYYLNSDLESKLVLRIKR